MKKVLIVVPELSYSGSVFSSKRICMVLIEQGYTVDVWSHQNGPFKKEFNLIKVPVKIVDKKTVYGNKEIIRQLKKYDLAIVNTIIPYALADIAKNIVPTIWYIREAQNLPWQFFKSDIKRYYALKRAENIYTVSEYAKEFISVNYNPKVTVVHNCVEDVFDQYKKESAYDDGIIRFLALGTLEERKAFDVLVHAYIALEKQAQVKSEIHFAGRLMDYAKSYYEPLLEEIKNYEGIYYHGEIQDRQKILQLIANSDVVVVPSKDESCSLVTLEAAMMGKPIIVSNNVGAKYIINDKNGWIFQTDNVEELKRILKDIVDKKYNLTDMGIEARNKYLETSTFEIYKKNIIEMVNDNLVRNICLYRMSHLWKRVIEHTQRKFEARQKISFYQFPYVDVEPSKRVVLYAAGEVGQAFYKYGKKKKYNIVLWVDKNCSEYKEKGLDVYGLEAMGNIEFDYVLIAVHRKKLADEIKKELEEYGINKTKIKWAFPILLRPE